MRGLNTAQTLLSVVLAKALDDLGVDSLAEYEYVKADIRNWWPKVRKVST